MRLNMKKILSSALVLLILLSIISPFWAIPSYAAATYKFDDTYTLEDPLKVGEYNIRVSNEAANTLFVFMPDEIGVFEFSVPDGATIGWWGAYPTGYIRDPQSTTNVITREIKKVGDVAVIGIASSESEISLKITKVRESEGIVKIDYIPYENEHTPANGDYPSDYLLSEVDISTPRSAVLCHDGSYRLDSKYGPLIYIDLYSNAFSLAFAFGDYGALTMRGQRDGVYYDFKPAMKEYNDVLAGTSGVYPLTIDLIRFVQSYGEAQMWFKEGLSSFDRINAGGFDEESAWMVLCLFDPETAIIPSIIQAEDQKPETPLIIDYTSSPQSLGAPVTYIFNNSADSVIRVNGEGSFEVIYSDVVYASVDGVVTIENAKELAEITVDGAGSFSFTIDTHTFCDTEIIEESSPTHTAAGRAEYLLCKVCGKKYDSEGNTVSDEDLIIPATGHSDAVIIPEKAYTCSENGNIEYYFCESCDKKYSSLSADAEPLNDEDINIPARHNYSDYEQHNDGLHIRKCGACLSEETEAHAFSEGCCTVCGYEKKVGGEGDTGNDEDNENEDDAENGGNGENEGGVGSGDTGNDELEEVATESLWDKMFSFFSGIFEKISEFFANLF